MPRTTGADSAPGRFPPPRRRPLETTAGVCLGMGMMAHVPPWRAMAQRSAYTTAMPPKIIFLDFDGVLHPCTAGTFMYLERLETFLRAHECLQVVLSTSWREHYPWSDLVALFSPDVRPRLIGATPTLNPDIAAVREKEIRAWLAAHGYRDSTWVALDDDESLFSPYCPWLVKCETIRGLRPAQLQEIEQKLDLRR